MTLTDSKTDDNPGCLGSDSLEQVSRRQAKKAVRLAMIEASKEGQDGMDEDGQGEGTTLGGRWACFGVWGGKTKTTDPSLFLGRPKPNVSLKPSECLLYELL